MEAKNREIATEILNQLGGNKFIAMTGARAFVAIDDGLMFMFHRGARDKINKIVITLNRDDTYFVRFCNVYDGVFRYISAHNGIYADNLADLISDKTGLAVRL